MRARPGAMLYRLPAVMTVVWLCSGAFLAVQAAAPLKVFVSVPPQRQFAESVGGRHVRVSVMVRPGYSPATYEPTPRQMAALGGTQLYWRIGVPFEQVWMKRIQAVNPSMHVVDARDGIVLRDMESAVTVFPAEPGDRDHRQHQHGQKDPHIWLSPALVRQMCERFKDALVRLDPDHRAEYQSNFEHYAQQLDQLDGDIRRLLAGVHLRRFMVFHPAWGYFAHAYGLRQIPVEIEGKSPGPRTLETIIDLARRDHIRVIFVQQQFSRSAAESVATAIGGKLVAVDPLSVDYLTNLREVARVFAQTMR